MYPNNTVLTLGSLAYFPVLVSRIVAMSRNSISYNKEKHTQTRDITLQSQINLNESNRAYPMQDWEGEASLKSNLSDHLMKRISSHGSGQRVIWPVVHSILIKLSMFFKARERFKTNHKTLIACLNRFDEGNICFECSIMCTLFLNTVQASL